MLYVCAQLNFYHINALTFILEFSDITHSRQAMLLKPMTHVQETNLREKLVRVSYRLAARYFTHQIERVLF